MKVPPSYTKTMYMIIFYYSWGKKSYTFSIIIWGLVQWKSIMALKINTSDFMCSYEKS